jgi:hypothetical protein
VSRVRSLSVRSRWAIVLGLTTVSFAVAQRASATSLAIADRAAAQSERRLHPRQKRPGPVALAAACRVMQRLR